MTGRSDLVEVEPADTACMFWRMAALDTCGERGGHSHQCRLLQNRVPDEGVSRHQSSGVT